MQRLCEIITARELGADTYELTMAAEELGRLARPGQFLHIKCGDAVFLRRPISICDCRDGFIKIVFRVRGAGTRWLSEQKSGKLDVLGPLGRGFDLNFKHVLLAGGGIGVPPLLYTAGEVLGLSSAILGFSSAEQIILHRQFRERCKKVIISTDDGSAGIPGLVTGPLEDALRGGGFDGILACGPRPMLRAVSQLAAEYSVACQVSLEESLACGVGACLGCAVPMIDGGYLRVCEDGPVFSAKEVNWDA